MASKRSAFGRDGGLQARMVFTMFLLGLLYAVLVGALIAASASAVTIVVIAVALFGFTLSYDEFARTLQTVGGNNTVPIEIWSMTQNVTSPSIYALGTLTTALSFLVIGISLGSIALIQRRRRGGLAKP